MAMCVTAKSTFVIIVLLLQDSSSTVTDVYETFTGTGGTSNLSQLRAHNTDTAHKPVFTNCSNYAPSVEEEQNRGAYVTTVKAVDEDPPESGGNITYSIVKRNDANDRKYFDIDPVTGVITTANQIDRDEPVRQKEFYVTVKATDNGLPILEDICTFKVTIIDVNDNTPAFDKSNYEGKVSEDLKVDAEVMRVFAYDIDDGENAKLTYKLQGVNLDFDKYFRIDDTTGVIYLKTSLASKKGWVYESRVDVSDNGSTSKTTSTDVKISVVGSGKQPPSFIQFPSEDIYLNESLTNLNQPVIINVAAVSNIEKAELQFELIKGLTKQTNQDATFQLKQRHNEADIILGGQLDYEKVTEYSLTVSATNADSLTAVVTINIKILDVNDEIPTFINVVSGSVLENDPPGAEVMQVRAIDKDGTEPNNAVTYELTDNTDKFMIDPKSGKVTTKATFDREEENIYYLTIVAKDGAPSALLSTGEPNTIGQKFTIKIEDRNDNEPTFQKPVYYVGDVLENTDVGKLIFEIKAIDKDIASLIKYSIIGGNIGDAFTIEEKTGRILVASKLDFEKTESYNLTVSAFDGIFTDKALVIIQITNVNDEPPEFDPYNKIISILEETIPDNCIIVLTAHDPDVKDKNADQGIVYQVGDAQKPFLSVDGTGCVRLTQKLDRDPPTGYAERQAFIFAYDNNGINDPQSVAAELNISLIDLNDNAPFLKKTEMVWNEAQAPGDIGTLLADDYDTEKNGPPFKFRLSDQANSEIKNKFSIIGDVLRANVEFDREEKKYYKVPIDITDSGTEPMTGTSYITVIIGDINDNPAKDGSSEIFVYNYQGLFDNIEIGRVYVDDPDDWDLPDKLFQWKGESGVDFDLNHETGMISMKKGVAEGNYSLEFLVTESSKLIAKHTVNAYVLVTIKEIPQEAVLKSGSIRLVGTIEDFIQMDNPAAPSKKEVLQQKIARILNTSNENVDVFTVLTSSNDSFIDVRFSAHGSPYYSSEKLNSIISDNLDEVQGELGLKITMISISECLEETACPPKHSCSNYLDIKNDPAVVFTNKTSFVGVKAVVEKICDCPVHKKSVCLNGGVLLEATVCDCPEGFEGPNCELLGIGFSGDGWAMYPSFDSCNVTDITLVVIPSADNGLIFYIGPMNTHPAPIVNDFMSLEVQEGYPILLVNYGSNTTKLNVSSKSLVDGNPHDIKIRLTQSEIQMWVDGCSGSNCQAWGSPNGPSRLLNVNGPLQVGGAKNDLLKMSSLLNWQYTPSLQGLQGCVRNLTYNRNTYNLGQPGDHHNAYPNCNNYGVAKAVSFSIDSNFLVAILVCIAILIILLLAVVVHRRKHDSWPEKDIDDIRETIISYEDEGGGEVDTAYDLSVLQSINDNDVPLKENLYKSSEIPDISGFLDSKKNTCDKDPNNYPFDDVRYYAYEGDGNSSGSLSSLASCTDDGDLKFNYLSSFGPRFRKLADMYGEQPSDDDSTGGGEESWC